MADPTSTEKVKILRNAGLGDDAIGVILGLPPTDVHSVSLDPSSTVVAGGVPALNWKDWPMDADGWTTINSGQYYKPQYAIQGDLVYLRGTFGAGSPTAVSPPIPAEARPAKRQRIFVNAGQVCTSVDLDTDGKLKTGGNGIPLLGTFTTFYGSYPKT